MATPALRIRIAPKFPSKVQGSGGITIDRTGGVVTIGGAGVRPAASEEEGREGIDNFKTMTPLRVKEAAEYADFTPAGPAVFTLPIRDKARQFRTLFDFINPAWHTDIQNGDDTHDLTTVVNSAFDSGETLRMLTGVYNVTDGLVMTPGQQLQGDGNEYSTFNVKTDFNMSALGVLRLGTAEPGPEVYDVGFVFQQDPNAASRDDVIHYPPAIYAQGVPRFVLDRIRIEGAWDGIDARGNSGGSYIGYVEIGALNKGIQIDGALDFFKGGHWHFWPFGFQNSGTPIGALYRDGNTIATETGEADNLAVGMLQCFSCKAVWTAGPTPLLRHQIGILSLDGNNSRIVVAGQNVLVSNCYSTKAGSTVGPDVEVSAGRLRIAAWERSGGTVGVPAFQVSGGQFSVDGGFINQLGGGEQAGLITGGLCELRGVRLEIPAAARTVPYIEQTTGGVVTMVGCTVPRSGGSSGEILKIGTDNAGHFVADNEFGLLTCNLPTGTVTGFYNLDKSETFTPAPGFATPGSSTFNVTQATGRLRRAGNEVEFWITLLFDITSVSGASGNFHITGFPFNLVDVEPLVISQMSGVGFEAANHITAEMSTAGVVSFLTQATAAGVSGMGTTQFAVRNGYILRLRGRGRVRN